MPLGREDVGIRIKQAREEAGLTQPQLASVLGLKHPQSISNYERGVTEPSTTKLQQIAEATNKDLRFFLGDVSEPVEQAIDVADLAAQMTQVQVRLHDLQEGVREIREALGIGEGLRGRFPPRRAANGDE